MDVFEAGSEAEGEQVESHYEVLQETAEACQCVMFTKIFERLSNHNQRYQKQMEFSTDDHGRHFSLRS